jgi:hypothetical protein
MASPGVPLDVSGIIRTSTSFVGNAVIINQVTAATSGGRILFKNNSGSDKMAMEDNGNFGIGTTSPTTRLHVFSSGIVQKLESSSSYTQLDFYNTTNTAANRNWAIGTNLYNYGDFNIMASSAYSTAPNASYTYLTIKNSGNVGIGTTSPSEKLHVIGATNTRVIIETQTNGGSSALRLDANPNYWELKNYGPSANLGITRGTTEFLTIDNTGNVGIGTTSPGEKLVVATGASGWGVFHGASGWNGLALMGNSAGSGSALIFGNDYAATPTEEYRIWLDGATDKLIFTPGATYKGDPSAITPTMVMDSGGNVGIGTTSPTHKLQVVGNGAFNSTLGVQDPDLSSNGLLQLSHDSTGSSIYSNPASSNASTVVLRLGINNSEKIRIANNGNVGIGTTSPYSRFTTYGALSTSTSQISIVNSEGGHTILRTGIQGITNSGFSLISADVAGTNQNTRLVVSSLGNVGIGTTSPQSGGGTASWLSLNGTAAYSGGVVYTINSTTKAYSYFESDYLKQQAQTGFGQKFIVNGTNTAMTILSSGNVGIGTTNPTTPLHVAGIIQIIESGNTAFYGGNYVRTFGDQSYSFRNTGGYIRGIINTTSGNFSLYNSSSVLVNQIATAGNSYFNGGNVGIGTDSPNTKLTVKGASTAGLNQTINIETGGVAAEDGGSLSFTLGGFLGSYPNWRIGQIGAVYESTNSFDGALVFKTSTAADGGTEKMRMLMKQ